MGFRNIRAKIIFTDPRFTVLTTSRPANLGATESNFELVTQGFTVVAAVGAGVSTRCTSNKFIPIHHWVFARGCNGNLQHVAFVTTWQCWLSSRDDPGSIPVSGIWGFYEPMLQKYFILAVNQTTFNQLLLNGEIFNFISQVDFINMCFPGKYSFLTVKQILSTINVENYR